MGINIIFYFFIIVTLLILLIDILPLLRNWFQRIHIGRFDNKISWNRKISEKGTKWLLQTPKIKVTDNTRFIFLDMLKGNYSSGAIQHWQEAALLLGLSEYLKRDNNEKIKNDILKYLDIKFNDNGEWRNKPKHIDVAILAFAVMKLEFIDTNKYRKAFDQTWELINEHIGEDGTVEYRKFMKSYRYVDTIGFICPFLTLYGIKYKKEQLVELALKQIKEFETYGMLKHQHIPCHVYKIGNKEPLGVYGWGRGLGWYAIGLIDTWNELPSNNKYKSALYESVINFAKSARHYQQDNGSWNWTVTRNEARADSSTTALLCWYLLNAAKIPEISDQCLDSANKALKYLMQVTRKDGAVDFSQGDTKDIGVYSNQFSILPFTQGFCIRNINHNLANISAIENQKDLVS